MPLTIKEDNLRGTLSNIALKKSLGELSNYYYAVHQPPLFVIILLGGGLLQAFFIKPYFLGITDSHVILQRVSAFLKPKEEPIVVSWLHVKVLEVKKVFLGKMVVLDINNKKYKLRMNKKVLGLENSEEKYNKILNFFNKKLNKQH